MVSQWPKKICHNLCSIKGVETNVINNAALQKCHCMDQSASPKCVQCGCGWETHMHTTYEVIRVQTTKIDLGVNAEITTIEEGIAASKRIVDELKEQVRANEGEQKIIRESCAMFAHFLKQNSISLFCDSMLDYLKMLIENSRREGDNVMETKLQAEVDRYNEQVRIYEQALVSNTNVPESTPMTSEDILKLVIKLESLPIWGPKLKEQLRLIQDATEKSAAVQTVVYQPPRRRMQAGMASKFYHFVAKIFY